MKKIKIVALVTMLVFTLGIGSAQAGTFANGPAPAGSVLASEIFGSGSALKTFPALGAKVTADYTMAATPGAGAWALFNYNLTNATFSTAVVPGDLVYTPALGGAVTIVKTAGGTSGSSTVQFRIDWTVAGDVGDVFTFTYDLKGLTGATVNLGVTMTQAGDPVDSAGNVNVFTMANGSTETVTAASAVVTYIDVAQDRMQFIDNFGVNNTDSIIGDFTFTDNGPLQPGSSIAVPALDAWSFANLGAGGYAVAAGTTVTMTLTGNFNAALGASACGGGTTGLYIVPVGGANVCAATVTATTATFNLTAARLALGDFTGLNVIRMMVDGVTAIDEGAATVAGTVNFTTTDTTYINDTFSGTLYNLKNNGSTCYLYNIPSPDNAGSKAYVRIINDSTIDGRIRATLTQNDGTATAGILIANLPLGETQVKDSAQIATALGLTTWTGRARVVINGEIPSMKCQGTLTQTVNGLNYNTNFSTVAP